MRAFVRVRTSVTWDISQYEGICQGPHLRYLGQPSMYAALSTLKRGDNTRQMRTFVRVRTSVTWDSSQCRPPAPGLNPWENALKA
ncbi:hypothetical protein J6590_041273 [Homalodisca vitripennis]|nr:hypothetical protein J6590_041273 [Homalodisca vitripennis]